RPPTFGPMLKALRRARDLTQEQLAEQVACSVETIKKIEASRLRPSQQLAALLADALDVAAAERPAFLAAARAAPQSELRGAAPPRGRGVAATAAQRPLPAGGVSGWRAGVAPGGLCARGRAGYGEPGPMPGAGGYAGRRLLAGHPGVHGADAVRLRASDG